jgi:hypothetical protein
MATGVPEMKPASTSTPVSNKAIRNGDSADRILKIVHRLQQEVRDKEADFQDRLTRTAQESERRVQEHWSALRQTAVVEAQETTRKEVTRSLLDRFHIEISQLQATFDLRLREAITENEGLVRLKVDSALAAAREGIQEEVRREASNDYQSTLNGAEKLIAQLKEDAQACANEWRIERQQFQERITTLERTTDAAKAVRAETLDDYKELERKLEEAVQSKGQLQLDLQRAVSELNSRVESGTKDGRDHAAHGEVAAIVQSEMVRVRLRLDEIEKTLSDPDTELGAEIRLGRTRSELEAYLKGLRYSLGEVTLEPATVQASCKV